MGKTAFYLAVILFSSLILAVGWVDLSLGSYRVELGPLGLPVQYSCPDSLIREHGLGFEQMTMTKTSILEVKKHVQSVELEVGENEGQRAEYMVSVTMNSGNRVECRMPSLDWNRVDAAMARTIRRCVTEFMAYARAQGEPLRGLVLTI